MAEFEDLLWQDGQNNMGGIQSPVYYALHSEVTNWPTLPAASADMTQAAKLSGDFQFQSGAGFRSLYTTLDTGVLRSEEQGEIDGVSYRLALELHYPGNQADALGFLAKVKNSNLVFVVYDAEGIARVVGSDAFPAKRDPGVNPSTTGQATADRKGNTIGFFSYANTPAPIYEGAVPLISGSGS